MQTLVGRGKRLFGCEDLALHRRALSTRCVGRDVVPFLNEETKQSLLLRLELYDEGGLRNPDLVVADSRVLVVMPVLHSRTGVIASRTSD